MACAQDKVDKFCQVIVAPKNGLSTKRVSRISFGENKWLFTPKDTTLISKLNYVNSLTTETDVLNYMAKLGWSLVNVHAGNFYTLQEVFYFKKTFDASEFMQ